MSSKIPARNGRLELYRLDFQRPKNQFSKLVLRSICALRKSSRTFFFVKTSSNRRHLHRFDDFFMDLVPMTKESGVLCLSEWWRPWFEKSEVTGIRQLFYCALGSPQPIQKSSLLKDLERLAKWSDGRKIMLCDLRI